MALGTLHSFDMHRGDDRSITYTVVDEAGAVVDVTAAAIVWVLAAQDTGASGPQPRPGSTLLTKSVGSGVVLVDAVNGDIRVDIDSVDTVALRAPNVYYHEVQITLAGKVTTIAFGNITLNREIIAPGP